MHNVVISMAVRRGDTARRQMLENFIVRRHAEIDRLLADYGVPLVKEPE